MKINKQLLKEAYDKIDVDKNELIDVLTANNHVYICDVFEHVIVFDYEDESYDSISIFDKPTVKIKNPFILNSTEHTWMVNGGDLEPFHAADISYFLHCNKRARTQLIRVIEKYI